MSGWMSETLILALVGFKVVRSARRNSTLARTATLWCQ
jgi:hypothetical protein